MAIKINVSHKDQEALHRALEAAGYRDQRRKFHCTIGFIEKMLPPKESTSFGDKITRVLQESINHNPLLYEVGGAVHLFGHVIAFLPTARSQENLRKINLWLSHKVEEISEDRWKLNIETLPQNYTPHLTLWHTRHPDHRFKNLEECAEIHPIYHLTEARCVIFNQ